MATKTRRQLSPQEVAKYFTKTPEDSVILKAPHAEITVTQDFIDKGIVDIIGSNIRIFGLFYVNIWTDPDIDNSKPKELFFRFQGKINSEPSNMVEGRNEDGEKTVTFHYNEGDTFISNLNVAADADVASKMLSIMSNGYLPNTLSYDEIAAYWTEVNKFNGIKLGNMSQTSIELIVSEMCRDPKNLSRPFRRRLAEDPKFDPFGWKIINITLLPRYSSIFQSLISGNPRSNVISAIARQRQGIEMGDSPVEEIIL